MFPQVVSRRCVVKFLASPSAHIAELILPFQPAEASAAEIGCNARSATATERIENPVALKEAALYLGTESLEACNGEMIEA